MLTPLILVAVSVLTLGAIHVEAQLPDARSFRPKTQVISSTSVLSQNLFSSDKHRCSDTYTFLILYIVVVHTWIAITEELIEVARHLYKRTRGK